MSVFSQLGIDSIGSNRDLLVIWVLAPESC
jgi:hypothetical protein